MFAYSFLTEDSRYSVPTVTLITASDKTSALKLARLHLNEAKEHLAVEIFLDNALLYRVSRRDDVEPEPLAPIP